MNNRLMLFQHFLKNMKLYLPVCVFVPELKIKYENDDHIQALVAYSSLWKVKFLKNESIYASIHSKRTKIVPFFAKFTAYFDIFLKKTIL